VRAWTRDVACRSPTGMLTIHHSSGTFSFWARTVATSDLGRTPKISDSDLPRNEMRIMALGPHAEVPTPLPPLAAHAVTPGAQVRLPACRAARPGNVPESLLPAFSAVPEEPVVPRPLASRALSIEGLPIGRIRPWPERQLGRRRSRLPLAFALRA